MSEKISETEIEHATSVKRIFVREMPTPTRPGRARFKNTTDYSIFDVGRQHPPTPLDNSTIAMMSAHNFELLNKDQIPNHYQGLIGPDGKVWAVQQAIDQGIALDTVEVLYVNRVLPQHFQGQGWDYSQFRVNKVNNFILPIEFISRNELPPEASVWKKPGEDLEKTLQAWGLPEGFKNGDAVPEALKPLLSYTTKFEKYDQSLARQQVQEMLGFSCRTMGTIDEMTRAASRLMTDYAESRGFKRLDGKVEYIVVSESNNQIYLLGDAVCTWHEDRLLWKGFGVSKQQIRNKAKALNPEWTAEIDRAKKAAAEQAVEDFRTLMDPEVQYRSPSAEFFKAVNLLFQAGTNQWLGAGLYKLYHSKNYSTAEALDKAIEDFKAVNAAEI
ncbi:MAG TPA: phosphoribosylaminoimidazolesuccinocarboxamide synthase [Candidatus Nanoarchaeia archaeon]|nr:phosphoribosylaminoimidazolesuccinocarboxamide synthase [Candidatus Nanoarchaeia archaeon]